MINKESEAGRSRVRLAQVKKDDLAGRRAKQRGQRGAARRDPTNELGRREMIVTA
jgi:hypothetical protein